MRASAIKTAIGSAFLVTAIFAWAQSRKPGLWETTSTMTLQQSPFPAGMPNSPNSPFGGGPRTTQVCLTQEQIDKYGAPTPASHDCQITNVVLKPHGMTADMVCSGRTTGKGIVESTWSEDGTATGTVHFVGTIQAGPQPRPIEWTSHSTSVYKGADCGSVKPIQ